jgi:hypothetical protein
MKQNSSQKISTTVTAKDHLMFFRGVKMMNHGKAGTIVSGKSKVKSACGLNMTTTYNMTDFKKYAMPFPESCCKKCLSRFKQLMSDAKELNKQKSDKIQ